MTYQEGFSYMYTSMDAQILAPKKLDIPLFSLVFYIAGHLFLLNLSKVYF